jgi:tetratricopeptide (TPR) repeat protein
MREASKESSNNGGIFGPVAGSTILILSLVFGFLGWQNLVASHRFAHGRAIMDLARVTENTDERIKYLEDAISLYEVARNSNPYHGSLVEYSGNAHNVLSMELRKKGDHDRASREENKAIEDLRRSINLINDIQIYLNLSSLYARKGDAVKAKEYARTAVAIQPLYIKPHLNLARIALQLEDYNLARDSLVSALMSDPKDPQLHYELGNLYLNIYSESDKASSHYDCFLKFADPGDSRIRDVKAITYKINRIKNMRIPDPQF